jgi:hypothetical protein
VVALSLRIVDSRTSSWMDVEKEWALKDVVPIIKAVSDAKYLILNVSNSTVLNDGEMDLFRKANVVMDTSGRNIINLGELLKQFGTDKFAFGSHAPILDYRSGLLRIEALRVTEADSTTRALLHSGNIRRLLNLS